MPGFYKYLKSGSSVFSQKDVIVILEDLVQETQNRRVIIDNKDGLSFRTHVIATVRRTTRIIAPCDPLIVTPADRRSRHRSSHF